MWHRASWEAAGSVNLCKVLVARPIHMPSFQLWTFPMLLHHLTSERCPFLPPSTDKDTAQWLLRQGTRGSCPYRLKSMVVRCESGVTMLDMGWDGWMVGMS